MRCFWGLAAVVVLALLQGCGDPGLKKYKVSGTVKYDGQSVADGDVTFIPDDKAVGAEGGKIKDGQYSLMARAGKNRVELRASRVVPGKKGPMNEDWIESYLPAKYNEKSTLTVEVGDGKTTHDFDLPE